MTASVSVPNLPAGEVHLWRVDLDGFQCGDFLSEDERARAARFHFERDRRRYIAGRNALRMLLGGYLQRDPKSLRFEYSSAGKPLLPGISFNLAHTGHQALVALAQTGQLGVDIEESRPLPDMDDVAQSVFAPGELARWRHLPSPEKIPAFYRIWTRKEAYLKASGEGIAFRLQKFEVSFEAHEPPAILKGAEGTWSLADVSADSKYTAAVAYESGSLQIKDFNLAAV